MACSPPGQHGALQLQHVATSSSSTHPAAVTGELAILVPALGTSQRLLNGSHAQVYFEGMPALDPGSLRSLSSELSSSRGGDSTGMQGSSRWFLRRHGDAFERLPGGAYRALGRLDDTMNLGGIKVGAGVAGFGGLLLFWTGFLSCMHGTCARFPQLASQLL